TVTVSHDGRFVSALLEGLLESSEFRVWDAATGDVVFRQAQAAKDPHLLAAELTNDGRTVLRSVTAAKNQHLHERIRAVPGDGNRLQIVDGPAYKGVHVVDHVQKRDFALHPTPWSVDGVRFSADGSKLLIAGTFSAHHVGDNRPYRDDVAVWDVRSGRL